MMTFHEAKVKYTIEKMKIAATVSSLKNDCRSQLHKHFNDQSKKIDQVYLIHHNKLLGKGTYGSVYLATHRISGIQRAVKILNIDRINSYHMRKLHNEIAILKSMDHNNISHLYDIYFDRKIGKKVKVFSNLYSYKCYCLIRIISTLFSFHFVVYIVVDLCTGGQLYDSINTGEI